MPTAKTPFFRCIPEFVSLDEDLHPYSRLLFVVIAHKVRLYDNSVQISTEELAKIAGLSVGTVLRYLPPLEAKRYIEVERGAKGSKIPNIYHIGEETFQIVVANSKFYEDANLRRRKQAF